MCTNMSGSIPRGILKETSDAIITGYLSSDLRKGMVSKIRSAKEFVNFVLPKRRAILGLVMTDNEAGLHFCCLRLERLGAFILVTGMQTTPLELFDEEDADERFKTGRTYMVGKRLIDRFGINFNYTCCGKEVIPV